MKVVQTGREESLSRIAQDSRVAEIVDVVRRQPEFLALVLTIVRDFHTEQALKSGRRVDGGPNLRKFLDIHVRKSSRASRKAAEQVATALERLYRDEDEGNVRGALLEALVEDRLRGRYHGIGSLLSNNLRFDLVDGTTTLYSSRQSSIDVIGFDGARGECHDCKVDSSRFERPWIEELERDVAPRGFMIGLATSHHRQEAQRNLKKARIQLRSAQLLDAEHLFRLVPLQP